MSFCRKCGNELTENIKFCPKCGTKVEVFTNVQQEVSSPPIYGTKTPAYSFQDASVVNQDKKPFVKIFNLISKIAVATLSFVLLLLVLFAPIVEAPFEDSIEDEFNFVMNREVKVRLSGIDIIKYGFLAMDEYTIEEAEEEYIWIYAEFREKCYQMQKGYATTDELEEAIDIIEPYRYALIDSYGVNIYTGEEYTTNNTFLEIQFVLGMIVIFAVIVILIIGIIFDILSIFKKDYTYKKSIKFWSISMVLLFFFVGALSLSGLIAEDDIISSGLDSTMSGGGLIACLIMVVLMCSLIYLHEVFNKNIRFNLFNVIGRSVAILLVIVSLFLLDGHFMSAKADGEILTELNPSIQIQVQAVEYINEFVDYETGVLSLPETPDILEHYFEITPEYKHSGEMNLNYFYISKPLSNYANAEALFILVYIIFIACAIVLSFSFASLINGLVTESNSLKHNANMIVSMSFIFVIIIINIILCKSFNDAIMQAEVPSLKFAIDARSIIAFVLILAAVISSSILIKITKVPAKYQE